MLTRSLQARKFDVFSVIQVADHIPWSATTSIDFVHIPAGQSSQLHKHEKADTYLFIVEGEGAIFVGESEVEARPSMLLHIEPGVVHGVRTANEGLTFISVQNPPILDAAGNLDLAPARPEPTEST